MSHEVEARVRHCDEKLPGPGWVRTRLLPAAINVADREASLGIGPRHSITVKCQLYSYSAAALSQ
jgi:hypothetical protein